MRPDDNKMQVHTVSEELAGDTADVDKLHAVHSPYTRWAEIAKL